MPLTDEEIAAACSEPSLLIPDFQMQHTMYRVKDPKVSLDFYTRVLGMRLLKRLHLHQAKMSLYLLGYEPAADIPDNPPAVLELAHSWGTESDPQFAGYCSGNDSGSKGGHIALRVDDFGAACEWFELLDLDVNFTMPGIGLLRDMAVIKDPDGYWIEIHARRRGGHVAGEL